MGIIGRQIGLNAGWLRLEGRRAMRIRLFGVAAALSGLVLAGCARRESPAPEAQTAPTTSAATVESGYSATTAEPMPATVEAAPATTAAERSQAPSAAPSPTTKTAPPPAPKRTQGLLASPGKSSAPAAPPSPEPQSAPKPAASEPSPSSATPAAVAPAPAPSEKSASKVDDPGGAVSVASTNPGATRIGPEKCKICHKLQHASWAEGPHARRSPPLDCESCHGPGSEYKTLSTMRDLEKAKAAGLVLPDASFCATCHKRDWKSDMLSKTHAHKAKPAA